MGFKPSQNPRTLKLLHTWWRFSVSYIYSVFLYLGTNKHNFSSFLCSWSHETTVVRIGRFFDLFIDSFTLSFIPSLINLLEKLRIYWKKELRGKKRTTWGTFFYFCGLLPAFAFKLGVCFVAFSRLQIKNCDCCILWGRRAE